MPIHIQAKLEARSILRGAWGIGSRPPIDVEGIALALGLEVYYYRNLPRPALLADIDGIWCIGVERTDPPTRQRFSIAHELAHYLFDLDSNRAVSSFLTPEGSLNSEQKERRANIFAANLLMPEEEVRLALRHTQNVKNLASKFGVSRQAMCRRLRELRMDEKLRPLLQRVSLHTPQSALQYTPQSASLAT